MLIRTKLLHSEQIISSQPGFQTWEMLTPARETACKQGIAPASNNRTHTHTKRSQSDGEGEKRNNGQFFWSLTNYHY